MYETRDDSMSHHKIMLDKPLNANVHTRKMLISEGMISHKSIAIPFREGFARNHSLAKSK